MKRITIGLLAGSMSVLLLATGCGTGGDGGGGAAGTGDTIKIGANLELSGAVATYGQDTLVGVEMAVAEINAAGGVKGKQIELIKYDTKSEPAEATTLATKLTTQDKVLAFVGSATSGSYKASIPIAIANKVPAVSGSATADDVTKDASGVKEYAFRVCFSDSYQGTAMATYAATKLNAKSAVIIKDNASDYAKGLAENFKAKFTADGGTIVDEQAYVAGNTDFNAILTRIKAETFDVIYLPGYYQEAGLIIKAARGLGITAPVLGADGFDSPQLLELGGAAALNNVYFTNHYSSLDQDPNVVAFISAFKEKNGKDPNAFNALGYDAAKFIADSIGRADALTGESIKNAMAQTKDFPAVTGTFSVDADHNAVKAMVVIQLKDGVQASSEKIAS